jgi:hypothetical protein
MIFSEGRRIVKNEGMGTTHPLRSNGILTNRRIATALEIFNNGGSEGSL